MRGGWVVEVHENGASMGTEDITIEYRTGHVDNDFISWGKEKKLMGDMNNDPSLIKLNDNTVLVMSYNFTRYNKRTDWVIGKLDNGQMKWGETKSIDHYYNDDDSVLIALYKDNHLVIYGSNKGKPTKEKIGVWNEKFDIEWYDDNRFVQLDDDSSVSELLTCDNGLVLRLIEDGNGGVWCAVGKSHKDDIGLSWSANRKISSIKYGYDSTMTLLPDGRLLHLYNTSRAYQAGTGPWYFSDIPVDWDQPVKTTRGVSPDVTTLSDGRVLEVHCDYGKELYYKIGTLTDNCHL